MKTAETQSWVEKLSQTDAEECLDSLHDLAGHLDGAMDAIVKRQLPALQTSLYLQQATCARLADIRHRSNHGSSRAPEREVTEAEPDLSIEIKAATESLLILNSRYSALLKHSRETLRLLAGLYGSYRGSVQQSPRIQASLQTWSCEI